MRQEPWLNFGLHLGDGELSNDSVVVMTEAIYRWMPDEVFAFRDDRGTDELTEVQRAFAWRMLGRSGPPPRMRLVIRTAAIDAAAERVAQRLDEQRPVVDRVQELLDSYKTNKQRRKRMNALDCLIRDNQGYGETAWIIELFALKSRLKLKQVLTAREVEGFIYGLAKAGKAPLSVVINGERITIPQEVIDRSTPPDC